MTRAPSSCETGNRAEDTRSLVLLRRSRRRCQYAEHLVVGQEGRLALSPDSRQVGQRLALRALGGLCLPFFVQSLELLFSRRCRRRIRSTKGGLASPVGASALYPSLSAGLWSVLPKYHCVPSSGPKSIGAMQAKARTDVASLLERGDTLGIPAGQERLELPVVEAPLASRSGPHPCGALFFRMFRLASRESLFFIHAC